MILNEKISIKSILEKSVKGQFDINQTVTRFTNQDLKYRDDIRKLNELMLINDNENSLVNYLQVDEDFNDALIIKKFLIEVVSSYAEKLNKNLSEINVHTQEFKHYYANCLAGLDKDSKSFGHENEFIETAVKRRFSLTALTQLFEEENFDALTQIMLVVLKFFGIKANQRGLFALTGIYQAVCSQVFNIQLSKAKINNRGSFETQGKQYFNGSILRQLQTVENVFAKAYSFDNIVNDNNEKLNSLNQELLNVNNQFVKLLKKCSEVFTLYVQNNEADNYVLESTQLLNQVYRDFTNNEADQEEVQSVISNLTDNYGFSSALANNLKFAELSNLATKRNSLIGTIRAIKFAYRQSYLNDNEAQVKKEIQENANKGQDDFYLNYHSKVDGKDEERTLHLTLPQEDQNETEINQMLSNVLASQTAASYMNTNYNFDINTAPKVKKVVEYSRYFFNHLLKKANNYGNVYAQRLGCSNGQNMIRVAPFDVNGKKNGQLKFDSPESLRQFYLSTKIDKFRCDLYYGIGSYHNRRNEDNFRSLSLFHMDLDLKNAYTKNDIPQYDFSPITEKGIQNLMNVTVNLLAAFKKSLIGTGKAVLPVPNAIFFSGHGIQMFWLADKEIAIGKNYQMASQVSADQKLATAYYKKYIDKFVTDLLGKTSNPKSIVDTAVAEPARLMRFPLSYNNKGSVKNKIPCAIAYFDKTPAIGSLKNFLINAKTELNEQFGITFSDLKPESKQKAQETTNIVVTSKAKKKQISSEEAFSRATGIGEYRTIESIPSAERVVNGLVSRVSSTQAAKIKKEYSDAKRRSDTAISREIVGHNGVTGFLFGRRDKVTKDANVISQTAELENLLVDNMQKIIEVFESKTKELNRQFEEKIELEKKAAEDKINQQLADKKAKFMQEGKSLSSPKFKAVINHFSQLKHKELNKIDSKAKKESFMVGRTNLKVLKIMKTIIEPSYLRGVAEKGYYNDRSIYELANNEIRMFARNWINLGSSKTPATRRDNFLFYTGALLYQVDRYRYVYPSPFIIESLVVNNQTNFDNLVEEVTKYMLDIEEENTFRRTQWYEHMLSLNASFANYGIRPLYQTELIDALELDDPTLAVGSGAAHPLASTNFFKKSTFRVSRQTFYESMNVNLNEDEEWYLARGFFGALDPWKSKLIGQKALSSGLVSYNGYDIDSQPYLLSQISDAVNEGYWDSVEEAKETIAAKAVSSVFDSIGIFRKFQEKIFKEDQKNEDMIIKKIFYVKKALMNGFLKDDGVSDEEKLAKTFDVKTKSGYSKNIKKYYGSMKAFRAECQKVFDISLDGLQEQVKEIRDDFAEKTEKIKVTLDKVEAQIKANDKLEDEVEIDNVDEKIDNSDDNADEVNDGFDPKSINKKLVKKGDMALVELTVNEDYVGDRESNIESDVEQNNQKDELVKDNQKNVEPKQVSFDEQINVNDLVEDFNGLKYRYKKLHDKAVVFDYILKIMNHEDVDKQVEFQNSLFTDNLCMNTISISAPLSVEILMNHIAASSIALENKLVNKQELARYFKFFICQTLAHDRKMQKHNAKIYQILNDVSRYVFAKQHSQEYLEIFKKTNLTAGLSKKVIKKDFAKQDKKDQKRNLIKVNFNQIFSSSAKAFA